MKDRRIQLFFLLLVAGVLAWGVFYPNLSIVIASFQKSGNWTLSNYSEIASSSSILRATWNSIWISVATVVGSAIAGVGLALLFQFYEFPGRRLFAALAPLPLFLPPLIGVLAFIFLYGESGILSRLVMRAFGMVSPPWRLNGPGAILAVHIYTMYTYFYIFTSAGLQRFDYSLLEAARVLGASQRHTLFKVLLPLLRPALISAGLLTFMNSMASFSAPYLFGGGTPMLTLQIFNTKVSNQWNLAMAESVILATLSLSGLFWLQRAQKKVIGGSKGVTAPRQMIQSRFARALATGGGLLISILLLLPPVMLLLMSFVKDGTWTMEVLPPVYTLENYKKVFSNPSFAEPIINSLSMSGMASLFNLIFSLPAAYLLVRGKFRGQKFLSLMVLVPSALPGTVLALSFAASFNRPTILTAGEVLVGTFWILPIIYFLRNIPLAVRSVQSSLEQFDENLEGASRNLGASFWYTLRRIILPLVWPGALSGAAMAFATSLGEFVASILVYVPSSRPISVEIASQLRYFQIGSAAVYGLILILLTGLSLIVSWRFAGLDSRTMAGNV
jgi:iron(III) transport system permease protein